MRLSSVLLGAIVAPLAAVALDLRLITYNIRQINNRRASHEMRWGDRRPLLTQQLQDESNENTLMCFQEAFHHAVEDIQSDLGSSWSYVGKGRDNGNTKGEYSPIFFRNDIWDVDSNNTLWLSKTPDKPSRGWDATMKRIVTVAELTHKSSGDKVNFMCTHFDWEGRKSQAKSAEIIVDLVKGYGDDPVFVAGDLNLEPGEDPYNILTSELTDFRTLTVASDFRGRRAFEEFSLKGASQEDVMTYTGFNDRESDDMLIDFIFVKDPNAVSEPQYSVPSNKQDGKFISDHRPVIVDLKLN